MLSKSNLTLLFCVAIKLDNLFHKGSEPFPERGRFLLNNGYIRQWEPDTNRFIYDITDKGQAALVDTWLNNSW